MSTKRLADLYRDRPAVAPTDSRPFVIFADQVGTMNKDSAEALDVMCTQFAERGVNVHVVCQSEEAGSVLEENYAYWQDGGDLRRHAFYDGNAEIWHTRGEAGVDAFLAKHGKSLSGYLKVQDVPNPHHRTNTVMVHPGQLAEAKTFAALKNRIDRATGALAKEDPVYRFIGPKVDGEGHDVHLLGGKGAGLAHMARLGLPVPPGFTISTEACRHYMRAGELPEGLLNDHVRAAMTDLETYAGRRMGDPEQPLFVSVRSGAPESMPGMMDTVLNVGMNETIAYQQAQKWASNPAMVASIYDTYGRFISSYSKAVLAPDLPADKQQALGKKLADLAENMDFYRDNLDTVDINEMNDMCREFTADIQQITGSKIPQEPHMQVRGSVEAVMKSWNSDRAVAYRQQNNISDDLGTAVTIQSMVMGNHPYKSGAGVLFSRNVTTGEPRLSGNYMPGGQGEDVVSGSRGKVPHLDELRKELPEHYDTLRDIAIQLEMDAGQAQEVEFCVAQGELFILQARNAKCTPEAEVRIALDMAKAEIASARNSLIVQDINEGDIFVDALHKKIDRIDPGLLMGVRVQPDALATAEQLAQGEAVCSTAASGIAVFNEKDLLRARNAGRNAIFISSGSLTDDYESVNRASGTLVIGGNPSSHAAVVARSMGKAYVCSVEGNLDADSLTLPDGKVVNSGDKITLGENGEVLAGDVPLEQKPLSPAMQEAIALDEHYREGKFREIIDGQRAQPQSPPVAQNRQGNDVSITR